MSINSGDYIEIGEDIDYDKQNEESYKKLYEKNESKKRDEIQIEENMISPSVAFEKFNENQGYLLNVIVF